MKKKVTIEETIVQTFEIDVDENEDIFDKVNIMYRAGELVLDDVEVSQRLMQFDNTDWLPF